MVTANKSASTLHKAYNVQTNYFVTLRSRIIKLVAYYIAIYLGKSSTHGSILKYKGIAASKLYASAQLIGTYSHNSTSILIQRLQGLGNMKADKNLANKKLSLNARRALIY